MFIENINFCFLELQLDRINNIGPKDGIPTNWSSILHFTINGNSNTHGFRCPALFFPPYKTVVYVVNTVNGNANFNFEEPFIPIHDVTSVYIEQKSISSRDKHAYRLYVNGTVVKEVINNEARAFQNVLVYGSDPWHEAADVTIRDFQFGSL